MVSWAPKTPCIQQVAQSIVSAGQHLPAAAQQRAVPAGDDSFLVPQHNVTVMGFRGNEEGQGSTLRPLDMHASAIAHSNRLLVERVGDRDRRILKNAAGGEGQGDSSRRPVLAGALHVIDHGEVFVGRRLRMVGVEDAKKCPGRRCARGQGHGPGLKRRAAGLILQAARRQALAERERESIGVAVGGTHQLAKIGGEGGSALETTMRDPRMRASLRQILPAHHDVVGPGMRRDEMIEILARIGLVAHDEALFAETEILDERRVAVRLRVALVDDQDAPEPNVGTGMQPEADLMAQSVRLSLPDRPVAANAGLARRLGPDERQRHRLCAADTQVEAAHASGYRRPEHLIDHDASAARGMLHGEDRAVRQEADRKPGPVGDP